MANNVLLSNPTIQINNQTYQIVPNSLVYDAGEGETNVRTASAGGASVVSVHSENAETKISMVKFDIFLLIGVDKDIATWKANVGGNGIKILQKTPSGESTTISGDNMSLTAPVERNASADGVTSLEFKGDPMSI